MWFFSLLLLGKGVQNTAALQQKWIMHHPLLHERVRTRLVAMSMQVHFPGHLLPFPPMYRTDVSYVLEEASQPESHDAVQLVKVIPRKMFSSGVRRMLHFQRVFYVRKDYGCNPE